MIRIIKVISFFILLFFASCKNDDWDFPDYKYQSVYFAYQYPVRTVILGDNIFSTELDNDHQFEIMATTGGVYQNLNDIHIDFTVDNSLLDNLLFEDGDNIVPLPDKYYSLESNQIIIPKGKLIGGVKIQLSDGFFNDPKALKKTYVLSLRMIGVKNADTILAGQPKDLVSNPVRGVTEDWEIPPKDFTFYAIKFINEMEGFYLVRGKDVIKGKIGHEGMDSTIIRHEEFIVNDPVAKINSLSLTQSEFSVVYKDEQGQNIPVSLILDSDGDGNISISGNSDNYSISGSGLFTKNGAKNSWGDKDHDLMVLDYTVDLNNYTIRTQDTLVMRNRGISMETFSPVVK